MTDIVKRLRSDAMRMLRRRAWEEDKKRDPMLIEAADEIERLRAALKEIRDAGPMTLDDQRWRIALVALGWK